MSFLCQGEDVIRSSGVPYTIIRPCALTEEPAGAELQFDQGDNITVSLPVILAFKALQLSGTVLPSTPVSKTTEQFEVSN